MASTDSAEAGCALGAVMGRGSARLRCRSLPHPTVLPPLFRTATALLDALDFRTPIAATRFVTGENMALSATVAVAAAEAALAATVATGASAAAVSIAVVVTSIGAVVVGVLSLMASAASLGGRCKGMAMARAMRLRREPGAGRRKKPPSSGIGCCAVTAALLATEARRGDCADAAGDDEVVGRVEAGGETVREVLVADGSLACTQVTGGRGRKG